MMSGEAQATGHDRRATRFPALDGLRGLAALGIIATHVGFASGRSLDNDLPAALLGRMDFGLAVFFLLSGFLLYRPFALHTIAGLPEPRSVHFWWRRALRIFPALWVMLAFTLGIITVQQVSASEAWHYLLLVQVYDHHDVDPNLSQLWTLSAEIAFYALLPVIAMLVARRARDAASAVAWHVRVLVTLIVIAGAFNVVQDRLLSHTQAQLWLPAYLDWFALGMLLAVLPIAGEALPIMPRLARVLREWSTAPGTCWATATVLWLLTTTQLGSPRSLQLASFWQWTVQHYLYGAAAFLVMVPLVANDGGLLGRVLGSRPLSILGEMSYGVYLWHLPLLLLFQRELDFLPFSGHFWTLLGLTTVASIGIAAASWYTIERPILRHGSRPWRFRTGGKLPTIDSRTAETLSN